MAVKKDGEAPCSLIKGAPNRRQAHVKKKKKFISSLYGIVCKETKGERENVSMRACTRACMQMGVPSLSKHKMLLERLTYIWQD